MTKGIVYELSVNILKYILLFFFLFLFFGLKYIVLFVFLNLDHFLIGDNCPIGLQYFVSMYQRHRL